MQIRGYAEQNTAMGTIHDSKKDAGMFWVCCAQALRMAFIIMVAACEDYAKNASCDSATIGILGGQI